MEDFQDDIAYFKEIPWCLSLINNPQYAFTATFARQPKSNSEDELLSTTLKTSTTIPACVSLYKKPTSPSSRIEELRTLVALGPGVNGWVNMLHGGIAATLLDEVMGILLHLNNDLAKERARVDGGVVEHSNTVTAELTTKYLRVVPTPSTICVRVWLVKAEGRKGWVEGTIEDGQGTVLVKGSGLFIQVRPQKI
jgi:acyl-coenzyme A thioesterase THEM4